MAIRKRRYRSTKKGRAALAAVLGTKASLRREVLATQNTLNDRFAIVELERRCLLVERDYADLRQKLVSLLLPAQIDAAKTCGVTPEVYALEWIAIYKDRWRESMPGYAHSVKSLMEVKNG